MGKAGESSVACLLVRVFMQPDRHCSDLAVSRRTSKSQTRCHAKLRVNTFLHPSVLRSAVGKQPWKSVEEPGIFLQSSLCMDLEKAEVERAHGSSGSFPRMLVLLASCILRSPPRILSAWKYSMGIGPCLPQTPVIRHI